MAQTIIHLLKTPIIWAHKFLFKNWKSYGHAIEIPGNDDWGKYIQRVRGGSSGFHGNPHDDYDVKGDSFILSKDVRDWANEHQVNIKFVCSYDYGNATYPRDGHLLLTMLFLRKEDAIQFKLTYI